MAGKPLARAVLVLAHAAKASQITWRSLRRLAPVTEPIDEERWQLQTEQEALQNLRSVLELCANGKLKVSDKTFKPSAAALETITEHLVNGDFYDDEAIAAFAWPLLVQAGGLAKLEGGRLRLTPKGRAALDKPAAETIRLLWWRWLSHGVIDEFSRIEQIKGQRATNVLTAVKPRREIVAKALAGCQVGEWLDVDALFMKMRRGGMNPTIARTERALWKLHLEDPEYGSLGYDGFHDWDVCAGHVLVEEAGGRVSLFDGRPVVYGAAGAEQRNGLLASNGRVHDAVVGRIA